VLKEAVSERIVDLEEGTNDGMRQLFFNQIDPWHTARSRIDPNH
jgi:hypothetical protein